MSSGEALRPRRIIRRPIKLEPELMQSPQQLCALCQHLRSDHYRDKEKKHAHFRDSMQMKGLEARMFPNSNPEAYCHVPMCTACPRFVEEWEEPVLNMPGSYVREKMAAKWIADAKAGL